MAALAASTASCATSSASARVERTVVLRPTTTATTSDTGGAEASSSADNHPATTTTTGTDTVPTPDTSAPTVGTEPPLSPETRAKARIQIDLVTGMAAIAGTSWLFDALAVPGISDMLAINPGIDGIGAGKYRA